jgi:hypothetical protein
LDYYGNSTTIRCNNLSLILILSALQVLIEKLVHLLFMPLTIFFPAQNLTTVVRSTREYLFDVLALPMLFSHVSGYVDLVAE